MTTTFTAAVCTKGRPSVVAGCLAALRACDPAPMEIVVVDGDGSAASVCEGTRYFVNEPGLTRQRNRALREARGDVVAFFDDDARPSPGVFGSLAAAYEDPGVVGATGPILEPGDHVVGGKSSVVRRLVTGWGRPGTFTRGGYPRRYAVLSSDADVEFMQGAFMTVRRPVALELLFDESLPGYGLAEDEDFSRRLSLRGRIRYGAAAVVEHENLGFGGRDQRAFNRMLVVNRRHLFRKNFEQTPLARLSFAWMVLVLFGHRLVNREWQGVLGLIDGLRSVLGTGPGEQAELSVPRTGGRRGAGVLGTGSGEGPELSVPRTGGRGVVFVSSHGQDGGSERYLERLIRLLPPDVVGSVVILEDGPMAARVDATVIPTGAGPLDIVRSARLLRRHAKGSLVHANGVKAAVVSVAAGLPTVWVKHDHSYDGRVGRLIARRCRAVVGVSEAVLRGVGGGRVVHTGIDIPSVDRVAARALVDHLAPARPVVTLVGRLDPVKGHHDLLAALPPGMHALFVGPEDPHHRMDVPGWIGPRDDVLEIMAGSDVVAVPSTNEGFGLVAAEALSVGTPVVGYAVGALPEVVGDCGVLVPAGDIEALRSALADPPDGSCGPARIAELFSVERWVAEMLEVYDSAARASGKRAKRR
jgi:glycosyltransferase involved in cell wall biosynthesis/GT2 family glycosyltransferase